MKISFKDNQENLSYYPAIGDWFTDAQGCLSYCFDENKCIGMALADGKPYGYSHIHSIDNLTKPFKLVGRIEHYNF